MPYTVGSGSSGLEQALSAIGSAKFSYDYPGGMDFSPKSSIHKRLVEGIMKRARESSEAMSVRYKSWRDIDRLTTTYQYVDEKEDEVKKKDSRKPVSIIFPYTYAVKETLLTYLTTAFFQDPIFTYEGVGPEDTVGATLLTLLTRMHCSRNKVPLALHTMFSDALSYGIAPVAPSWETRYGGRTVSVTSSAVDINGQTISSVTDREVQKGVVFEGNRLDNIDPYKYLPDPNVPSHKIQDGEYVGWWYTTDRLSLLSKERSGVGFNAQYLKLLKNKNSFLRDDKSGRNLKEKRVDFSNSENTNKVDVIVMYVNLVPKEWGLGPSNYPEKWWFEVAADGLLIQAMPIDQHHGLYPMAVACPDFDGYTPTPLSRLETLYGLQHTMDFLFNSHIANVRKAINDMIVIDPWMININDVKDPKPGKIIRTRRPSWGKGRIADYVQQLAINDVTRGNLGDSNYIAGWMQRLAAADDSMMGMTRDGGPERLTGVEFSGTRNASLSRLNRLALMISLQAMQDIGFFFASHAQQYMSKDTYVKVLGDLPEEMLQDFGGETRKLVKPEDLIIEYDIIVRDGSIPGGNFSNAWIDLFKTIGLDPELRKTFDVVRLFTYIARNMGAKNVSDFKRNAAAIETTTMQDEDILNEMQKGNIVPREVEGE